MPARIYHYAVYALIIAGLLAAALADLNLPA
jgi:hypothetical protein